MIAYMNDAEVNKLCYGCYSMKPQHMFPARRGKLLGMCTVCYEQRYGTAEAVSARQKAKLKEIHNSKVQQCRMIVYELLKVSKCKHCEIADWEVLEFDHIDRTTKYKAICDLVVNAQKKRLLEEIKKCEIVCANCHRKRTMRQFGYWKLSMVE